MCAMLQQLMNKELAMKLLKSKLLAIAQQQKAQEIKDIKGGKLLSG
jgi:protein subunit release factor B